ncbi:MAG: hypothetical protein GF344_20620 [Chitinivibrionales bacterium]|nr:hypothetical protein [Chitinivibrionales bacterium]MBD3359002.1 hypothetical protein [Chitinivibrionales bacterium]
MIRHAQLIMLSALLVFACTSKAPTTAGGEDFPNSQTVIALGEMIAEDLNESQRWNAFDGIANSIPATTGFLPLIDGDLVNGKGFDGVLLMETDTLWDDTANGIVKISRGKIADILSFSLTDTMFFAYEDSFKDSIDDNERLLEVRGTKTFPGADMSIRFNTVIAETPGRLDTCRYLIEKQSDRLHTYTTFTEVVFVAGKDELINSLTDNRLIRWSETVCSEGDTLQHGEFKDADGDGELFTLGQTDSAIVTYTGFRSKTDVETARHNRFTLVFFPGKPSETYPIRYHSMVSYTDGSSKTMIIYRAESPDSSFSLDDTTIIFIAQKDADGGLDTTRFQVLVSGRPPRYEDNQLLDFGMAHTYPAPGISRAWTNYTPKQSPPSGRAVSSGTLWVEGVLSDQTRFELDGSFGPDTITALYSNRNIGGRRLTWNRAGEPIAE